MRIEYAERDELERQRIRNLLEEEEADRRYRINVAQEEADRLRAGHKVIEEQHLARVYLGTDELKPDYSKPYEVMNKLYPNFNTLKMLGLRDIDRN